MVSSSSSTAEQNHVRGSAAPRTPPRQTRSRAGGTPSPRARCAAPGRGSRGAAPCSCGAKGGRWNGQSASLRSPGPLRCAEEVFERVVNMGEPVDVGDPARGLEDEPERRRHLIGPNRAGAFFLGDAIEGVVDLDRGDSAGVVAKHVVRRQVRRVRTSPSPLLVGPAAGADKISMPPCCFVGARRSTTGLSAFRP